MPEDDKELFFDFIEEIESEDTLGYMFNENIEEIEDVISQIYEEEGILTLKLKEDFESYNDLSILEMKEKHRF